MATSKSRTPAARARVSKKAPTRAPSRSRPTGGARALAKAVAAQKHVPTVVSKPVHVPAPVAPRTAKATKPAKAAETAKASRVRDKFTMPEADYALIAKLKLSARRSGLKAKKSELLRLGLRALDALSAAELQDRLLTMRIHDKRSAKQHVD